MPVSSWPLSLSYTQRSSIAWPMPCASAAVHLAFDDHRIDDVAEIVARR